MTFSRSRPHLRNVAQSPANSKRYGVEDYVLFSFFRDFLSFSIDSAKRVR